MRWSIFRHAFGHTLDQRQHRLFQPALVNCAPLLEPLAAIVALQAAQKTERLAAEIRLPFHPLILPASRSEFTESCIALNRPNPSN
jgi:hypothetical protein